MTSNVSDKVENNNHLKYLESNTLTAHDPILIVNNIDFTTQAQLKGWSGNGSRLAPFIIENLNITGEGNLIQIEQTSVYFSIRNCLLEGGYNGIILKKVSNGNVQNSIIRNNTGHGVYFNENVIHCNVSQNYIANNKGFGIFLKSNCDFTLLESNTVIADGNFGIQLKGGNDNCTLRENFINYGNIRLENSFNCILEGNTVANNSDTNVIRIRDGVYHKIPGSTILRNNRIIGSSGRSHGAIDIQVSTIQPSTYEYVIQDNFISDIIGHGIGIGWARNGTIRNNTIELAWNAIHLHDCKNFEISENTLINNRDNGVSSEWSENISIRQNNLINNTFFGVELHRNRGNITVQENNFLWNNLYGASQAVEDYVNWEMPNLGWHPDNYTPAIFQSNFWDDWAGPDFNSDGKVDNPYGSSKNSQFASFSE